MRIRQCALGVRTDEIMTRFIINGICVAALLTLWLTACRNLSNKAAESDSDTSRTDTNSDTDVDTDSDADDSIVDADTAIYDSEEIDLDEADSDIDSDSDADLESDTDSDLDMDTDSDSDADLDSDIDTTSENHTSDPNQDSDSAKDTASEMETDADVEKDSVTRTDSDGVPDSETISDSHSDLDSEMDSVSPDCGLDILETFDSRIPTGWTVIPSSSASGTGSGSGSGSGRPRELDEDRTWHHISEDEDYPYDGMEGGFLFVGGFAGMNEALITNYYEIGRCESVSVMFDYYFDDAPRNDYDRSELWINADGPPWQLVGTYNVSGRQEGPKEEIVDLTHYLTGSEAFQLKFTFVDEGEGNYGFAHDNVAVVGDP